MKNDATASVIVNAHREGLIAVPTLRSLARSIEYADSRGYKIDVVLCLDRVDSLTREIIEGCALSGWQLFDVDFGDLGLSRNFSISKSKGQYISFLDADDMFSVNWLERAINAAENDCRKIVWHPELNIFFGDDHHIYRHVDMESPEFELPWLVAGNPWTALCFGSREIFEQCPYPRTDLSLGIGYEDWGWSRAVIEEGYIHKVVKGTGHAIRRKPWSLVKQSTAAGVLPVATNLFRAELEERALYTHSRAAVSPPR